MYDKYKNLTIFGVIIISISMLISSLLMGIFIFENNEKRRKKTYTRNEILKSFLSKLYSNYSTDEHGTDNSDTDNSDILFFGENINEIEKKKEKENFLKFKKQLQNIYMSKYENALQSLLYHLPSTSIFKNNSTYNVFYKKHVLFNDIYYEKIHNTENYSYCCELYKGVHKAKGYKNSNGFGFYKYDHYPFKLPPFKFKFIFNSNNNTYNIHDTALQYIISYDIYNKLQIIATKDIHKSGNKVDFVIYPINNNNNEYVIRPAEANKYITLRKLNIPESCNNSSIPCTSTYYIPMIVLDSTKEINVRIVENNKTEYKFTNDIKHNCLSCINTI